MFSIFDRISFYTITEAELDAAQASGTQIDLVRIEDGVLDLAAHEAWEDANRDDIAAAAAQRARAIEAAPFLDELTRPREEAADAVASGSGCVGAEETDDAGEEDGCERVKAGIPGRCWRLLVEDGDKVKAGSALVSLKLAPISFLLGVISVPTRIPCEVHLVWKRTDRLLIPSQAYLESCKMEVMIPSPVDGVCVRTNVKEGAVVDAHDTLMVVRPDPREEPSDT